MSKGSKPRALRLPDTARSASIKDSPFYGMHVRLPPILDKPDSMRRLADWLRRAAEWIEGGEGK